MTSEWIKCSERLPPKDMPFLCFDGCEIAIVSWFMPKDRDYLDGWFAYESPCSCCNRYCGLTFDYWMALPQEPTEKVAISEEKP